jgi:predicted ATPase
MKIQSVYLKHFKRFKDQKFDFTDPETGLAKDLIVLVGANGSGKTSVLQAIAALVGNATGRLKTVNHLKWPGFNLALASGHWRTSPTVEIQVEFSSEELHATQEFWRKIFDGSNYQPANESVVTLQLQNDKAMSHPPNGDYQFKGREYATRTLETEGYDVFKKVGTILWYTDQRTSTSLTPNDSGDSEAILIDEDLLRDRLAKFEIFHRRLDTADFVLRPGQRDFFGELEKAYQTVFPDSTFVGIQPRQGINDFLKTPWFYLRNGQQFYEISELSGGERAVLPILMDFVNWRLHHSIILIDELELHLHPPMQQMLLLALGKLGSHNQFILTTHSDYVESIVPESALVRMEE